MSDRPGGAPFDAVLCDVDNVIRTFDLSGLHALERAAGLAEGTTTKVAFAPEVVDPVVLGRVDLQEWAQSIADGLAGMVPEESTAWSWAPPCWNRRSRPTGRWSPCSAGPAPGSPGPRQQRDLRLEDDLTALGLADLADDVVNSARVGLAKPDPRIYRLAASLAGVRPERCLFVDDNEQNVAAATALGMQGVHFHGAADLERALEPMFT